MGFIIRGRIGTQALTLYTGQQVHTRTNTHTNIYSVCFNCGCDRDRSLDDEFNVHEFIRKCVICKCLFVGPSVRSVSACSRRRVFRCVLIHARGSVWASFGPGVSFMCSQGLFFFCILFYAV